MAGSVCGVGGGWADANLAQATMSFVHEQRWGFNAKLCILYSKNKQLLYAISTHDIMFAHAYFHQSFIEHNGLQLFIFDQTRFYTKLHLIIYFTQ